MADLILLYTGSVLIIVWGIGHLIPTASIVAGFGQISEDNRKIITMESIAEGITLIFLGALVLLVILAGGTENMVSELVVLACAILLFIMALLTLFTGARTTLLPYTVCPIVKIIVAILFVTGITI